MLRLTRCHVCILLTSWLLGLFCICVYVCYHYVVNKDEYIASGYLRGTRPTYLLTPYFFADPIMALLARSAGAVIPTLCQKRWPYSVCWTCGRVHSVQNRIVLSWKSIMQMLLWGYQIPRTDLRSRVCIFGFYNLETVIHSTIHVNIKLRSNNYYTTLFLCGFVQST